MITIILGPTGAGKSTHVQSLRNAGREFLHIDRDRLIADLIEHCGHYLLDGIAEHRAEALRTWKNRYDYSSFLKKYLEGKDEPAVIDYIPGGPPADWALTTVKACREAQRNVEIEGIYADPQAVLPRIVKRHKDKHIPAKELPAIMDADGAALRGWLNEYRHFPELFLMVARLADRAVLFDNSGASLIPIAEWSRGQETVHELSVYSNFLRLRTLQPQSARCEADPIRLHVQYGESQPSG
jgi:adenylate kinase family enzyme